MRLKEQFRGEVCYIYALVLDNGDCPAEDFLEKVRKENFISYKGLVRVYTWHANFKRGVWFNPKKSKPIQGRRNLYEFKSKQGDRLIYFLLYGGRTVLTHGFHKGVPARREYDRGEQMRDQYLEETAHEHP